MKPIAAVTGAAISQVGRRLGRSPIALTVEAVRRAVDDAGLQLSDIDGIATYPGAGGKPFPGHNGASIAELRHALGLKVSWFCGAGETPGQLGALFDAVGAIAAGLADHVLVYRSLWESTAQTPQRRASVAGTDGGRASGVHQWTAPFGAMSAVNLSAMFAARHFHQYGTTREQLAQIALNGRANAANTDYGVYQSPLTLDDYLSARVISTPLCLYDCDAPIDGATAVIVSRASVARQLRRDPLYIESLGSAFHGSGYWDQFDDLTSMAARDASEMLWQRSDFTPKDVQIAELYDGFSIFTLIWLEALGFCGKGEAGQFVEGGKRIALDGDLPVNTGGGQLSGGRLHGYGLLYQACRQLWGQAGRTQVAGDPKVAVVGVGGGPLGGAMLLAKD
ncbi:thiolase family protein [Rhodococcus sp. NPDC057014]|uniref:thiolase family protein n=1 Tax=Rhodococcus sp. NPDC057014 TaxID=3346000 RepID=UPI00363DC3FA